MTGTRTHQNLISYLDPVINTKQPNILPWSSYYCRSSTGPASEPQQGDCCKPRLLLRTLYRELIIWVAQGYSDYAPIFHFGSQHKIFRLWNQIVISHNMVLNTSNTCIIPAHTHTDTHAHTHTLFYSVFTCVYM